MSFVFKIIIIGNANTGKSSILDRFVNNRFINDSDITIGVELGFRTIVLEDYTKVKLRLYDTAGQCQFRSLTKSYYRNSVGAIIVYDVSNRKTFDDIHIWIKELKENCPIQPSIIILAANKTDLEKKRQVTQEEGLLLAEENNFTYAEVSCKQTRNVNEIFYTMSEYILDRIRSMDSDTLEILGVKRDVLSTIYLKPIPDAILGSEKKCCT